MLDTETKEIISGVLGLVVLGMSHVAAISTVLFNANDNSYHSSYMVMNMRYSRVEAIIMFMAVWDVVAFRQSRATVVTILPSFISASTRPSTRHTSLLSVTSNGRGNIPTLTKQTMENVSPYVGVKEVSTPRLLLSVIPLLLVVVVSWSMNLDIGLSILISAFRTFVQLTILGSILQPVFAAENIYVVVGYCFLMMILAAFEACRRTKYNFKGQFFGVLKSLVTNVTLVGLLAFGIIIRPEPLWNPQYVIPITGMLLGNCITGIALSLNNMTKSLVEQRREIELYLSFGATSSEAVARLLREAVKSGATPILNTMSVIGIVSIPGMMTGQILGGSSVIDAARYQMLIVYLIAMCTLGVIFMNSWLSIKVGFDSLSRLRPEKFEIVPPKKRLDISMSLFTRRTKDPPSRTEMSPIRNGDNLEYGSADRLEVRILKGRPSLSSELGESLEVTKCGQWLNVEGKEGNSGRSKTLFQDVSFIVRPGDIYLVQGPSGCGKTSLLRCIAGLDPLNEGRIKLGGKDWHCYGCGSLWRRHVRYISQYKVDLPGTPVDFIRRVTKFKTWRTNGQSEKQLMDETRHFTRRFGLDDTCIEKEWNGLSGGEAQRVIIALAVASKIRVLLLDECTAFLDTKSKLAVEKSIEEVAKSGVKVLWVSHDTEQVSRMGMERDLKDSIL